MTFSGRRLTSRVRADSTLELALTESEVGPPGADEVVVRVEATPVNPSDIGLLLAGADPASTRRGDEPAASTLLDLPPDRHGALSSRLDKPLPVGNEGAGTVVAAGPGAEPLLGRVVSGAGGGMWAEHRLLKAEVIPGLASPGTGQKYLIRPS